jgi:UMF1 family MFS transporter
MTASSDTATAAPRRSLLDLGSLTPSGMARVPFSWALYDFANTVFSYAVVSFAMGLWLTAPERGLGQASGQAIFSAAVVISVGLNAIFSPVLGAMSDRGGRRLPFLLFFTVLVIVPSSIIGFTPAILGAVLFAVANFAYQAALIFYDATLKTVSRPESRGRLSGIGVGIGYLGTITAGILFLILIQLGVIVLDGVFVVAGILFAVFAVPIFVFVHEPATSDERFHLRDVPAAMGQLPQSIRDARAIPGLLRFLVARFFYSDAVNTIIVVMSVIAVRAMGLTESQFVVISLMLTVIAVLASFVWGWLVDRFGPKRTLLWVLASWAIGLVLGAIAIGIGPAVSGVAIFLVAGAIVGSGLGGVQVADRVFMIRLSPPAKLGEFFGLYGLVGKGSQVVGQSIYGLLIFLLFDTLGNGAYQIAVLSLIVTMIVGYWLIRPVSDRWGEHVPTDDDGINAAILPERLAPMSAPLEPRK